MKIAAAMDGNSISGHFGRTSSFMIFTEQNGEILSSERVETAGNQHSALPPFLSKLGVQTVIAGGMGPNAANLLKQNGITAVTGAAGDDRTAVEEYLAGKQFSNSANCTEHDHEHEQGHTCQCGKN